MLHLNFRFRSGILIIENNCLLPINARAIDERHLSVLQMNEVISEVDNK